MIEKYLLYNNYSSQSLTPRFWSTKGQWDCLVNAKIFSHEEKESLKKYPIGGTFLLLPDLGKK